MHDKRATGGIGAKLREARERRSMSLRQIANVTRISVSALEAIERNDVSRLPGGIFSRAFMRSFAVEVGLDPEQAVRDFIAQFPDDSVTAGHPTIARSDDFEDRARARRDVPWSGLAIALSVVLALVLLYVVVAYRTSAPPG